MKPAFEKTRIFSIVAVALLAAGFASAAETFYFVGVSNNTPANVQIGENQFSVTISEDSGSVYFLFNNAGPAPSTITNIYYDMDPSLSLVWTGFNYPTTGVQYELGANPADMKNAPSFVTTGAYSPESPAATWGIDPGEQLGIVFAGSYDDAVAAMASGDLQIGLHAQSIGANEGSEWFLNTPGTPVVPAPASIALAAFGLACIRSLKKRKTL